jgi:hypothetical protein
MRGAAGALLGVTLALGVLGAPRAGRAQCVPDPPAAGDQVSCTGDLFSGYVVPPGTDDVHVVVEEGASITTIGDGVRVNAASTVDNRGTLTIDGIGSSAIATAGGQPGVTTVTNASTGVIRVRAEGTAGVQSGSRTTVVNDGAIDVVGATSFGVTTGTDSRIENRGTLTVTGEVSFGLAAGARSSVLNDTGGLVTVTGEGATGLAADLRSTVTNRGLVVLDGQFARGLGGPDAGSRANAARLVNETAGSILVRGADSAALSVGRFGAAENAGSVTIDGDRSVGVRVAADGLAINSGGLVVNGRDAVGLALEPTQAGQSDPNLLNGWNRADPSTGSAGRIVAGRPDAGPLVQLFDGGVGIHRFRNDAGAVLQADLGALGTPGRAIAVQGSSGADTVLNAGSIEGRVVLGDGDDTYVAISGGSFADLGGGGLDGGAGADTVLLSAEQPALGTFTLDALEQFESLRVGGYWAVSGTSPTGLDVTVDPGGTLRVDAPTRIDGALGFATPGAGESRGSFQAVLGASSASASELLRVTDLATVDEGALDVVVQGGFVGSGTFTILRADTDLVGQFASVLLPSDPGVAFGPLVYDDAANTVTLSVSTAPYSPNETATSDYLGRLEAAGPSSSLQSVIDGLATLDYTSYGLSMNQLHPEVYDVHTTATLELGHRHAELLLERPRRCIAGGGAPRFDPRTQLPCRPHRFEPWVAVYGQLGHRSGGPEHVSWSDQGAGLVFGLDHRPTPHVLLNASVGTAYGSLDAQYIGKGRLQTIDLGLYAGYRRGPVRVQGVLGYGYGWQTRYRNIELPGFARTAEAQWGTNRVGARIEADYTFDVLGLDLSPMASVDYTALIQDAIMETGALPVALQIDGRTDDVVTVRAGLDLTTAYHKRDYWTDFLEHADGVWRPTLSVRWRQVVNDAEREVAGRFRSDPTGTAGLLVVQADAPAEGFEIGAGVDWTPRAADRLTFGLRYDLFVWTGVTTHDLVGQVRFSF